MISVAAELAGVHPQTLRVYERQGLVDPSRTGGGSRRFSERDLGPAAPHPGADHAGLNLEGVRRVLALEAEVERLRAELDAVRRRGPRGGRAAPTASTGGTWCRSTTPGPRWSAPATAGPAEPTRARRTTRR